MLRGKLLTDVYKLIYRLIFDCNLICIFHSANSNILCILLCKYLFTCSYTLIKPKFPCSNQLTRMIN